MIITLLVISGLYALFTLSLWLSWLRMPTFLVDRAMQSEPLITVIIPVRNEAETIENLLDDLRNQTYSRFEVIVADDSSTDDTLSIVQAYASTSPFALHPLPLSDERTASPKKRAITQSIARATGDLIVTTDGDCRVGPDWLITIAAFYERTSAKLISGPVTFTEEKTLFDSLQTVEFASLIGTGACTMALGMPTMCNGANLCYEKRVFDDVGGFSGVDHLASGDDELLMHKIASAYPDNVHFLKNPAAIVKTNTHKSWRGFYNQRKRWASKWRAYTSYLPTLLAVFVFLSNAAPVVAVVGWLLGFLNGNGTLLVIGLKLVPEFLFLRQILVFLQKKSSVSVIPLTQLVYPLYVIFFGLAAQGKGYSWKGRNLN
ncbi:glycosyltransferase family 2 protein [Spirosoma pollinicola]|uniref:Glycosyl transferase family 2 n=1 Tax=Spirosoma pollinicola TaxID=2057025 RepID=A0A2K8Z916_9BACT|nr:glycosyltransferase [Spirosoma pollinicola]AUD06367.1 glycosyl transferase family 2 [Spirosoma pollinicola]